MKNGTPLFLERPMHLSGEWEMCLNQLYISKSQISIYTDSTLEFKIELVPKCALKTEKHRLWNEKLKNLGAGADAALKMIGSNSIRVVGDLVSPQENF